MYTPCLYPPDIITPAHRCSVYASGMVPGALAPFTSLPHQADENDGYEDEKEENLIPMEMNKEALETELSAEAQRGVRGSSMARAMGRTRQ
jgi:hypothetical protein